MKNGAATTKATVVCQRRLRKSFAPISAPSRTKVTAPGSCIAASTTIAIHVASSTARSLLKILVSSGPPARTTRVSTSPARSAHQSR
jgi:hypothetical protein